MNAEESFEDFYQTEGIRYFEDLTHRGFMRHAFLHGWAMSRAKEIENLLDGLTPLDLKAVANYHSLLCKS